MASLMKKGTFTTELNADSTEWCPIDKFSDIFVCGTYQLSKNADGKSNTLSGFRLGCLYLFQFSDETTLKLLQQLSMPGILDCKWCHVMLDNNVYLALANAVGEIRLFKLIENDDEICLKEISKIKVKLIEGTLLLSLDWSTGVTCSDVKIIASSSTGDVIMISLYEDSLIEESIWKLHNFEAWIVCFNYWNLNTFYSGGDDSLLKCFDLRVGHVTSTSSAHDAGVTSLHMNTKIANVLISGSYDENVLFWDIRNMKNPRNILKAGGGVWRLKWEPKNCSKICASCMYFGSIVIDATIEKVIAEYKEHKSINYGIDWSYLSEERICNAFNIDKDEKTLYNVISVCSFYDNLLSLALLKSPL